MIIEVIAKNDLHIVKDLAYKIWPSAYAEILSDEQLSYMLEKFYSKEALEKQMIERNHVFLVIKENNIPLGFASYELNCENNQKAKLHKIYVLPNLQQKGIGKLLLQEFEKRAKDANSKSVFLNVNRNNKAQDFYKKYNYIITKQEDISIGNGYLMEDYVMEKQL